MISFTTIIRHILIDWESMADTQNKMRAYQKEMGEARKSGNEPRMRKLMEMNPQVMLLQSEMMSNQMRPMMFTMLIAIPIIMWLRIFVEGMNHQVRRLIAIIYIGAYVWRTKENRSHRKGKNFIILINVSNNLRITIRNICSHWTHSII